MNPARTLGPAIILGYRDFHWNYWVDPIAGELTAGFVMQYLFVKEAEKQEPEN